jgi:UDP-glucuronate 4-epimerase
LDGKAMNLLIDTSKTYLVTGAAGFIGYHLSKSILEQGGSVAGYDNMNDYYDPALKQARVDILEQHTGFKFYKADLVDKQSLEAVFSSDKPQIVVNLAAQAGVRYSIENPDAYIQANLIGFANILEMCRHHKVEHLLYASSSSVYGSNKKLPFSTEDRVDNPISLYAATKKSNELLAHTYSHLFNLPTTGLRFFTVYGPYGRPDMAAFLFLKAIIKGEPIKVYNYGNMRRDFTYVDDIINGILLTIQRSAALHPTEGGAPYHVYNIGNNRPEKLMDFIGYLEKYAGKKAEVQMLPLQPGDVMETYADIDDLARDTGFAPKTALSQGLKNFVEWYLNFYNETM